MLNIIWRQSGVNIFKARAMLEDVRAMGMDPQAIDWDVMQGGDLTTEDVDFALRAQNGVVHHAGQLDDLTTIGATGRLPRRRPELAAVYLQRPQRVGHCLH